MDLRVLLNLSLPVLFLTTVPIFAAPKLRLDNTAIGPISITQGANGAAQTVSALNAGDGNLNLRAASSATWLVPTVQPLSQCGFVGPCIRVNLALNTASLAKGIYTGVVTLADPNAIDAPQTVTVTVAVGGGVPDSMTLYVPKNGQATAQFTTARPVSATASSPAGGPALSVALSNTGSFEATVSYSYNVSASAGPAVNEGTYAGSFTLSGSTIAAENKTVPVTLNVTTKPILRLTDLKTIRVAQGAAKQTQYVLSGNGGAGDLSLTGATAVAAADGKWLSAAVSGSNIAITADPAGLAPGNYTGTVTVASNAANAGIAIPVRLEVVAAGPPVVAYRGVKSNATFTPEIVAQGDLPAVFGEQFTTGEAIGATGALTTSLGGATVLINDQPVPLIYVSQTQINFQVPYEIPAGDAVLRVDRDGQRGNSVSIQVARSAPKLLVAVNSQLAPVSTPAIPAGNGVTVGGAAAPVHVGDVVVIYALGFGPTVPAVGTGQTAPGSPLAQVPGTNDVRFGIATPFTPAVQVRPDYLGMTPGFVGLFQVNVRIPENAPRGAAVPVYVQGEAGTSNTLLFNIQ